MTTTAAAAAVIILFAGFSQLAVVWKVSFLSLISSFPIFFFRFLEIVPIVTTEIDITVTFIFHNFLTLREGLGISWNICFPSF